MEFTSVVCCFIISRLQKSRAEKNGNPPLDRSYNDYHHRSARQFFQIWGPSPSALPRPDCITFYAPGERILWRAIWIFLRPCRQFLGGGIFFLLFIREKIQIYWDF